MNPFRLPLLKFTLALIFLVSCSGKGSDPYPEFAIPVYSNSHDILIGFDESSYGKSVQYYIQEKFPASNIQEFYISFLSKRDFSELKNYPYSDKTWVKFNRKSLNWDIVAEYPPARYFRVWVDGKKNLIFKLTLSYKDDSDELSVTCFLHPYVKHELFIEFDKWVKDMRKEQEFGEFLKKYTKPDKKIDIIRALKENPKSELIRKFAKASEQDKQNFAAAYKAYRDTIRN